jgi:hypothetical protein
MGLDTGPSTYTGRRRSSSATMERSARGSGCCRSARRRTRRPAPGCWSYKGYAYRGVVCLQPCCMVNSSCRLAKEASFLGTVLWLVGVSPAFLCA